MVFACKTVTLGPELQDSMGPRYRLLICECKTAGLDPLVYWSQISPVFLCIQNNVVSIRIITLYGSQPSLVFFACKTATLGLELQVSMGPRPHLWFFAFKTASLAPQLQVPMGHSPHLWFLNAKQRLYDQN